MMISTLASTLFSVESAAVSANNPGAHRQNISEIVLTRHLAPWGRGADYTLVLKGNGDATFIGSRPETQMFGTYRTHLPRVRIAILARTIERSGFFTWASFWGTSATDMPEVEISAVRNGKRKVVIDRDSWHWCEMFAPPKRMGKIEEAIAAVAGGASWHKVNEAIDQPEYKPDPWVYHEHIQRPRSKG